MLHTERVYSGRTGVNKLMVGIVLAAIYAIGLWATGFLPTIPGVTWLRPANTLSEIFGVCFGWIGAIAVMFGNSLGDLLRGQLNVATLWWVFPIELIATALIVYWGVSDPSLRTMRGKIEWVIWAVIVQGLLTGFGIAFMLVQQGIVPGEAFNTIGWTITLNEAIPAVAAGFIQYLIFPRIVRMGLWWGRDLTKSTVPKELLEELRS